MNEEESKYNIETCINGIKLQDENLQYHIECLIREIENKRNAEVKEAIEELRNDIGEDEEAWKSHGKIFVKELLQRLGLEESK